MARVTSDLTITPIHPVLGARVEGVRLADPMDEATFRRIFDAFQEHSVLVFHDQDAAFHTFSGVPNDTARSSRLSNSSCHGSCLRNNDSACE